MENTKDNSFIEYVAISLKMEEEKLIEDQQRRSELHGMGGGDEESVGTDTALTADDHHGGSRKSEKKKGKKGSEFRFNGCFDLFCSNNMLSVPSLRIWYLYVSCAYFL